MVEMRDVSVVYSGGVDALHNVNLKINDGDFAFVVGPSGAGKSTMIKLILKEINPSSGTVFVNGYHLGKLKQRQVPALRRTIGFVFQDFRLIPSMTVYENIAFGLEMLKWDKARIRKRVDELLALLKIEQFEKRYPAELSGGQQQRVAIARALVKMPRVLLLDEPLSNLDARLRLQTREEIRRIQKETKITTVFVTHDQEEAMSISDMIVVMKFGVVQQIGKPQEVYDNPANLFVANFLGTPPINIFTGHVKGERLYIGVDNVMDVPGVKDQDVFVGIRPEGFILDMANGTLCCKPQNVEVMGRDVSVVSTHEASQKPMVRSIIDADNKVDASADVVRYRIKPHKIFLFTRDDEGVRIPFEVK